MVVLGRLGFVMAVVGGLRLNGLVLGVVVVLRLEVERICLGLGYYLPLMLSEIQFVGEHQLLLFRRDRLGLLMGQLVLVKSHFGVAGSAVAMLRGQGVTGLGSKHNGLGRD